MDAELPKSNQTSALSGKNALKMMVRWEKESLLTPPRWMRPTNGLKRNCDGEIQKNLVRTLSKSLAILSTSEDNSKLAASITQLAEVEEKVKKAHEQQVKDDSS